MTESQTRALRAAGRVTLTLSLFGCIEELPEITRETESEETDAEADVEVEPVADAGLTDFFVDAAGSPDGASADAVPADAAADALADGTPADGSVMCDLTQPGWEACCDANNWNPEAGCFAWGPPVPPALA